MADTLTSFLSLVKQTIGGNRNTWGGILNNNMDLIDAGIAGLHAITTTGGPTTLADDEWINRIIEVTGTLASNANIVFPNASGFWIVRNGTTGGSFTVSCKTSSGSAVEVIRGGFTLVWCDGNNVMRVGPSSTFLDTQARAPSGTLAAPGLSWASELGSGFYRVSSEVFAWVVSGVERLLVSATAFAVTLANGGSLTVTIDSTEVVEVEETGVNITGNLSVNGAAIVPVGTETSYAGILAPNGWLLEYGQAVDRTDYAELLAAITITAQATRNGTTTLSAVGTDLTGLGLEGAAIEGTGIQSSTTVSAITANTITLSQAASGSGTMTIRILPHGNGDGSTTFNIPDARGRADVGRDNMGGTSANRLTGQTNGIDGDKLGITGGVETNTIAQANLPSVTLTTTIAAGQGSHVHSQTGSGTVPVGGDTQTGTATGAGSANSGSATLPAMTGTTPLGGSGTELNNVQPTRVSNKIIFTGVFA